MMSGGGYGGGSAPAAGEFDPAVYCIPGEITVHEVQDMKRAFDMIDEDRSGLIDAEELQGAAVALGIPMEEELEQRKRQREAALKAMKQEQDLAMKAAAEQKKYDAHVQAKTKNSERLLAIIKKPGQPTKDDVEEVNNLLNGFDDYGRTCDVNYVDVTYQDSAISCAIFEGKSKLFGLVMQFPNPDLEHRDNSKASYTCLMQALIFPRKGFPSDGNTSVVQQLVKQKADIFAKTKSTETPVIHIAIAQSKQAGKSKVLEVLLAAVREHQQINFDRFIKDPDKDGNTPWGNAKGFSGLTSAIENHARLNGTQGYQQAKATPHS